MKIVLIFILIIIIFSLSLISSNKESFFNFDISKELRYADPKEAKKIREALKNPLIKMKVDKYANSPIIANKFRQYLREPNSFRKIEKYIMINGL